MTYIWGNLKVWKFVAEDWVHWVDTGRLADTNNS